MTRVVAHCLCRSFEVLVALGVLHLVLLFDAWSKA